MAIQVLCDYCRATIDTSSDAALIVDIRRRVDVDEWSDSYFVTGSRDMFRYCSQAHLAAHMQNTPLPPPSEEDDDEDEDLGAIGCVLLLLFAAVVLALAAGAAYGLYQLVTDVL